MTQIAQLSEAEIEERFHVSGTRPVAFLLAGFIRDGEQFSVQFGNDVFLTILLAVDVERGVFIFDCSGSSETNSRFLASQAGIFIGRPGGIHVQFTIGRAHEVLHGGAQAFSVLLPKFVVRLQRREFFRIETPRVRPLQVSGRLPGGSLLNLPAHDISVSGIALTANVLPDSLSVGSQIAKGHLALPEDPNELFFSARLRHLSEFEARFGVHQWRIGLQFDKFSPAEENRLQRYIARLEHERRELA